MRILFGLMVMVVAFFFFLFLVSAGVAMSVLRGLFGGRRQPRPDPVALQQLGNLSAGEAQLVTDALRSGGNITNLSDQTSIDSLIAKGIVVQVADASGIIDYRLNEALLNYLKNNRGFFAG